MTSQISTRLRLSRQQVSNPVSLLSMIDANAFLWWTTTYTRYQTCLVTMIQTVLVKTAKIIHVFTIISEILQYFMSTKTTSYESDSLRNWRFSWLQYWTPRKQAAKLRNRLLKLAASPLSPLARALYRPHLNRQLRMQAILQNEDKSYKSTCPGRRRAPKTKTSWKS